VNDPDLFDAMKIEYGGLALAASALVLLLDSPGMTIEKLRASSAAQTFREGTRRSRRWWFKAIECSGPLQPEEKRFLAMWYSGDRLGAIPREPAHAPDGEFGRTEISGDERAGLQFEDVT